MNEYMQCAKLICDRYEMLLKMPKYGVTCEVGIAFGDFSKDILRICQPQKHYLIDSWAHKGRYDDAAYKIVIDKFSADLNSGLVEIIKEKSIEGMSILPDHSVDFIYIDTDHSYETTKNELQIAKKKVKPDGIIAGHDYKSQGRYDFKKKFMIPYGVVEAVQEFMVSDEYDLLYLTNEIDGHLSFALRKHISDLPEFERRLATLRFDLENERKRTKTLQDELLQLRNTKKWFLRFKNT